MRTAVVAIAAVLLSACSGGTSTPASSEPAGTIPVTSKSPEAITRFERGVELFDNLRAAESESEFTAALALDPGFVLARAYHGQATPGGEGVKELESAVAAAGGLPEAERVLVEALLANRRGDFGRATELATRLTQLAPKDARGYYLLGTRLLNERKNGEAAASLKRAIELNPKSGGAQNMLGYAALRQGETDTAISAFNTYARMLPAEPNPQDSLGEALLAAGKFPEAEAAFRKAAELSPQFWNAWEGVAYTKLYAGDQAGANEALMKARDTAPRTGDKIAVEVVAAAGAAGRGDVAGALKLLGAAERTPGAQPFETALIPVHRAVILVNAGRAREAMTPIGVALQQADSGQLPPGAMRTVRREALRARAHAEAVLRNISGAEKTAAALDQEAAARPDDPDAQSAMHYGQGMLALAKGDSATARSYFSQCLSDDAQCKWQEIVAGEKAGDATAAAAVRQQLLQLYVRDPGYLAVRLRLAQPRPKTS